MPITVNDRDHIRSIFGDDFKKLIALVQLAPDSLELDLLVNRVDVKQEDKACQPAYPLFEIKPLGVV